MVPDTPPKAVAIEVVAAQPTESDKKVIAHVGDVTSRSLDEAVYVVKVRFEQMPPVTSSGWALYVGDYPVPKYWGYKNGIYFKIFDLQFFVDHQGQALKFTRDRKTFIDTGLKLGGSSAGARARGAKTIDLPLQSEVLK